MAKFYNLTACLFVLALVLMVAGIAFALDIDQHEPAIEQHLERACHRMVKAKAPHGLRDIRTFSYNLEAPIVGVAKGSFRTKIFLKSWSEISWTCRVHPKSGRVLRVEFGWPSGGGSRLLAAASDL